MIRFCPNCKTERPLSEFYCESVLSGGSTCNWDLSSAPIREPGSMPDSSGPVQMEARTRHCPNGHVVEDGDLICLHCGVELEGAGSIAENTRAVPTEQTGPVSEMTATEIGGWAIETRLPSPSSIRERFLVTHPEGEQRAVLTLYADGSEPDTAVYDAIRSLPHDHLPDIIAVGRWNDRAYEIGEEINGGTLYQRERSLTLFEVSKSVEF